MSADELPLAACYRAIDLIKAETGKTPCPEFVAFARYIATHEPAPVDPLREAVEAMLEVYHKTHLSKEQQMAAMLAELRARGVTAEPK